MATFTQKVAAGLKAGISAFKSGRVAGTSGYRQPQNLGQRGYDGAQWDRLTEDFKAPLTTGDAEMRTRLRTLRGRARELARNDPYTKRFLSRLCDNIYDHHGILFTSMAGEWRMNAMRKMEFIIDENDARIIEAAYLEWKKNPFVTGDMTLNEGGRLALRCTACDGETWIRPVIDSSINEFGFALQLFEADICDDNRNQLYRDRNNQVVSQIRMGVEIDRFYRPQAYWMLKEYPGDQQWWQAEGYWSERHAASEYIHPFLRSRITQVRDVTWLHAIMRDLKMLDGYDEAAIVAARTGASKMGFFTRGYQEPGDGYQGENAGNDKSMDAEPGLIEDLSQTPGLDFKAWDPAYPHEQYPDFIKARLRRIGAGLDMSYYAMANDLTEVNFSSIRAGLLEDRENFKAKQTWWINRFETPIFLKWLEITLLNGSLKDPATGKPLPFAKLKKFQNHKFRPRRWPWVDPEKDANAAKISVDNRFKSRTEVIEETSQNTFREVLAEQAAEQDAAESLGVDLPMVAGGLPADEKGVDPIGPSGPKGEQKPKSQSK